MDRLTLYFKEGVTSFSDIWHKGLPSLPDKWPRYVAMVAGATAAVSGVVVAWNCYQYRGVPPGPWGGLMGATHLVKDDTVDFDFYELSKKYGEVFSVRLGPNLYICLASHSAIKDAFVKQGDTFANRGTDIASLRYYLELKDDIFSLPYTKDGWNQTKSTIVGCLRNAGFGQTKSTDERIISEFEKLTTFLAPLNGKPINPRDILPKVTINIIFQILFSKEFDYHDESLDEKRKLVQDLIKGFAEVAFLPYIPAVIRRLFYTRKQKSAMEKTDNLRKVIRNQVEAHIESFDAENPRDFVDYYMVKFGKDDIPRLVDNIVMFIPDACDTLAYVIEWILLYVTNFQDVQTRIANEILKETGGSRHVNWSDRAKFPFTEATIREVIRISSVFNVTASHRVSEDTTFRGYRIPKEADIFALMYAVHRDPALYPDPDVFNPDRFIDSDGSLKKNDWWIPFGMGRRKCLGEQLVQIECFMIVANILQRYNLKFPEGETVSLEPDITSLFRTPKPFRLLFEERSSTQ